MYRDIQDLFSAADRHRDFWEAEHCEEREDRMMRSFYPKNAQTAHPWVAEECDRLDYPGSFLYDEYPDKRLMEQACRRIRRAMKAAGDCEGQISEELIFVLLIQEIQQRRRRGRRCRTFFQDSR